MSSSGRMPERGKLDQSMEIMVWDVMASDIVTV